jgi:hypothetical protein
MLPPRQLIAPQDLDTAVILRKSGRNPDSGPLKSSLPRETSFSVKMTIGCKGTVKSCAGLVGGGAQIAGGGERRILEPEPARRVDGRRRASKNGGRDWD